MGSDGLSALEALVGMSELRGGVTKFPHRVN